MDSFDDKYRDLMEAILSLRAKSRDFEVTEAYDELRNLIIKIEKWYKYNERKGKNKNTDGFGGKSS